MLAIASSTPALYAAGNSCTITETFLGHPVIGKKYLFTRAENEIMHDFEEYCHKIRDSVNLIILDIKKIQEQNKFLDI